MFRRIAAALAFTCVVGAAAPASAGVYADDLSKCLVAATTPDDQSDLIVWIFSAIASAPAVQKYSTITPDQRTAITAKAAALVDRLVTMDCRKQAVDAIKYEGAGSLETAFSTLGQVAMRGMMADPHVGGTIAQLNDFIDKKKWEALGEEAGTKATP